MATSNQGEGSSFGSQKDGVEKVTSVDDERLESNPKKKARRVNRQKLNGAIRHNWMIGWFINVVNIDMLEEAYYTPGSPIGLMIFVQFLMDKAKETMLDLATEFGQTGGNVQNAHKDDDTLQEMCRQCALNWKREWNLWKGSVEKTKWLTYDDEAFLWRKFTTTDIFWEMKREELAEEVEGWFNVVSGSISRVFIQKDKHYMLDEPITEPCLTCVSVNDVYSSWDDTSRIRSDSQHDYHLVRFSPKHFTKFYGASMMYVAKCFKNIDLKRQIMAQQRMFMEVQISGIRMCGLINPVAMVNEEDCPTLIFPYWNGGTLEDMLHNMKNYQDRVKLEKLEVPEHKLRLFMENRLEIALALLETLGCMHSKGWIHNNLHARNILLHFPAWQWTTQGEPKVTGSSDLVFVGISNFGKSCKARQANSEWAPKFGEWNWETKPHGPSQHIAPELFLRNDTNQAPWEGMRSYTEMTDVYALGTSIKRMCNDYFADWENTRYIEWHDRLNHTMEFRKRRGLEDKLLHLLHRMVHSEKDVRSTAKINMRQWRKDLGVSSQRVYRPLFGWSV